jgi:hypothetical protein
LSAMSGQASFSFPVCTWLVKLRNRFVSCDAGWLLLYSATAIRRRRSSMLKSHPAT